MNNQEQLEQQIRRERSALDRLMQQAGQCLAGQIAINQSRTIFSQENVSFKSEDMHKRLEDCMKQYIGYVAGQAVFALLQKIPADAVETPFNHAGLIYEKIAVELKDQRDALDYLDEVGFCTELSQQSLLMATLIERCDLNHLHNYSVKRQELNRPKMSGDERFAMRIDSIDYGLLKFDGLITLESDGQVDKVDISLLTGILVFMLDLLGHPLKFHELRDLAYDLRKNWNRSGMRPSTVCGITVKSNKNIMEFYLDKPLAAALQMRTEKLYSKVMMTAVMSTFNPLLAVKESA